MCQHFGQWWIWHCEVSHLIPINSFQHDKDLFRSFVLLSCKRLNIYTSIHYISRTEYRCGTENWVILSFFNGQMISLDNLEMTEGEREKDGTKKDEKVNIVISLFHFRFLFGYQRVNPFFEHTRTHPHPSTAIAKHLFVQTNTSPYRIHVYMSGVSRKSVAVSSYFSLSKRSIWCVMLCQ